MILMRVLAAVLVAVVNLNSASVIKANTRILCELGTTVDSRTAQMGDTFILRVNDDAQPLLRGAVIQGHITRVVQGGGMQPAEIHFLFDTITFMKGAREPIRAFVIGPHVVNHTASSPPPVNALPTGRPGIPNSIVWQTQIGPKTSSAAQTGGVAYASSPGAPIVGRAGAAVTIELASDLTVP
jgi:hypothetical protein